MASRSTCLWLRTDPSLPVSNSRQTHALTSYPAIDINPPATLLHIHTASYQSCLPQPPPPHAGFLDWIMKMVMEKSWNMQNWPKVMEFCYQSWNFTNFAPELYEICMYFATTEKFRICVESPYFPMFSAKCCDCKIEQGDGHGKLRNGHGKVIEKYFVKYVGTLTCCNPPSGLPEGVQGGGS